MDFLKQHEENTGYYHHMPNVVKTAAKIFKKFLTANEVICCADMQSGKSEVMKRTVEIVMSHNSKLKKNKIQIDKSNVFIILCASSIDLKNQLKSKIPKISHHIYHINDLQKFIKNCDEYNNFFVDASDNALVIFDECHCDVEQKKTIDKFRNIQDHLAKKNRTTFYRLGFSATPYEQISFNYPKVIMKPGENYYGLVKMFSQEIPVIYQALDLSEYDECVQLFDQISILPFYYIIRLPKSIKKMKKVYSNLSTILNEKNIKYNSIVYDMNYSRNINDVVKNIPKKMTIIFIKDKLRMGEYLDTQNVYLVHDASENSFTHTTAQSLLGRCCGYDKQDHKTLIYCDYEKAEDHYNWIVSNYDVNYIPRGKYSTRRNICYY